MILSIYNLANLYGGLGCGTRDVETDPDTFYF